MGNEREAWVPKELQVVKLRRPVSVVAEMCGGINIQTELPAGLRGTIVDLHSSRPDKAYVEHVDECSGSGFLFVVDIAEIEPADAELSK